MDEGLREGFENAIAQDRELKEEYELFASTMVDLNSMKDDEIQIPSDLHSRITARLESAQAGRTLPTLTLWRNVAIGALAASVVLGTLFSIKSRASSDGISSGIVPPVQKAQPKVSVPVKPTFRLESKSRIQVELQSTDKVVLRVFSVADGKLLETDESTPGQGVSQVIKKVLSNTNAEASALRVAIDGTPDTYVVVLPGTNVNTVDIGQGSILDFSLAVSGRWQTPVLLETKNLTERTQWNFEGKELKDVLSVFLPNRSTEVTDSDLVRISD